MTGIVLVGGCLGLLSGTLLGDMLTGARTPILSGDEDLRHLLSDLLLVLLPAVIITCLFNFRSTIADREAAVQVAQRQAAESRLRLLEAQLEPHMFFNTLANLHVLIGLDPPRAQAMLDQLISFLRATVSGSRATEHPLRAEFERTRDYLALMQVRMEERLRVYFDLPETLADVPVPPLLLQPLVENAIKHGIEPSVAGGRIEVTAARGGNTLALCVRDTGVGLGQRVVKGTGFGLQQVRERLATLYGDSASVTLAAADDADGGTLVVIRMPMKK
jgi:LytS/YehU family sensor histidine kinase